MPKMVCPRDRTIATIFGHVFEFKKDVPMNIPARLVAVVAEYGAVPAEGEDEAVAAATETELTDKQREPVDVDERLKLIVNKMLELHKADKLVHTAAGKPNPALLSKELHFRIDAAERDAAWDLVKAQILS